MSNILKLVTKTISGIGTFGELFDGGELVCVTVEQPWNNNEPFLSCVSAGIYEVKPHVSPSKGECFIMINKNVGVVETGGLRDKCLWHIANYPHEVQGCIGVGKQFMLSDWGVASSRDALDMLKEKYPEGFKVEIVRL